MAVVGGRERRREGNAGRDGTHGGVSAHGAQRGRTRGRRERTDGGWTWAQIGLSGRLIELAVDALTLGGRGCMLCWYGRVGRAFLFFPERMEEGRGAMRRGMVDEQRCVGCGALREDQGTDGRVWVHAAISS